MLSLHIKYGDSVYISSTIEKIWDYTIILYTI